MMAGALTGNSCLVEKKINKKLFKIKELYDEINKMISDKFVPYVCSIRVRCDDILILKRDIELLSLILHPEYRYSEIDANSFQDFLKGKEKEKSVRVIFFNENRNDYSFRYFKPEEK